MKRYIVRGKNIKSLLFKVAKHFQVDPRSVKYEILKKKPEFELKVWVESQVDEEDKTDDFIVEIEEDGIFLTVKKTDEKKALTLKRVLKELEEKKDKRF
jgi:preprotein translocase subunit SecB